MKEQVYLGNCSAYELEVVMLPDIQLLNPRGRVEHVLRSPCKMRETKLVEFSFRLRAAHGLHKGY